ncbi:hypothetical protein ACLB2K_077623 [Fragaria x ananassa]
MIRSNRQYEKLQLQPLDRGRRRRLGSEKVGTVAFCHIFTSIKRSQKQKTSAVKKNDNKERKSYVRQPYHVSCATHQSHSDTCFFSQLFFLPVAVFSLFSSETAHRRLHHTGSPSPRERGRKKKRREEEEEAERKGEEERKEEEEEEGRERKKKREEGRRRRGKKKKHRSREGRKKKKKQSCEKASPEEEIGFVGEERERTEEELKKKHVSL